MPRNTPYGFIRGHFNFAFPLPGGTAAAEPITDFLPGFAFTVEKVSFFTQVAATGAGATRVFRVVKNASTVVATTTFTLADGDTVGKQETFTVTAADAEFDDDDTLTIDTIAAGAVAFTAGEVVCVIQYRQRPQRVTN